MSNFKVSINTSKQAIQALKKSSNKYHDELKYMYSLLKNVDSIWNDNNVIIFLDKIKKDSYEIEQYFEYVDCICKTIELFLNNINVICIKYGYKKACDIKFSDDDIYVCKKNLTECLELLNDSLNCININDYNVDFPYKYLLYEIRSGIKKIKMVVNQILNNVLSFVKSINNEVEDSIYRVKKIKEFDLNIELLDYIWQISKMDI